MNLLLHQQSNISCLVNHLCNVRGSKCIISEIDYLVLPMKLFYDINCHNDGSCENKKSLNPNTRSVLRSLNIKRRDEILLAEFSLRSIVGVTGGGGGGGGVVVVALHEAAGVVPVVIVIAAVVVIGGGGGGGVAKAGERIVGRGHYLENFTFTPSLHRTTAPPCCRHCPTWRSWGPKPFQSQTPLRYAIRT